MRNRFWWKRHGERGAILVLVLLILVPLIAIVGLAIDLGRYYYLARQLQNAADFAALAGAQMLYQCDANNPCSVPLTYKSCPSTPQGGWTAVKPAILASLSRDSFLETSMAGAIAPDGTFPAAWDKDAGLNTKNDPEGFDGTLYSQPGNPAAGIKVEAFRWLQCIEGGSVKYVKIDPIPAGEEPTIFASTPYMPNGSPITIDAYCMANSVSVRLTHPGMTLFFIGVFSGGATNSQSKEIVKSSVSTVRAPICNGLPACSNAKKFLKVSEGGEDMECPKKGLIPVANSEFPACAPIITPTPTPTPTVTPKP